MRVTATYTGQRVNHAAIRHVFRDEDGPVGQDLDAMSRRVQARARSLVGVRTGLLLSTIRRERGQGPRGPYHDVVAGRSGLTKYLGYHMSGSHPHIIRPRRRRALRFTSDGAVVFARRVRHPGTRANPFLTRALEVLR
jgi:hypothetical protein